VVKKYLKQHGHDRSKEAADTWLAKMGAYRNDKSLSVGGTLLNMRLMSVHIAPPKLGKSRGASDGNQ
jgi:hypothetical protein